MIQFNLLPDVKLEFIKSQKMKRTVVVAAMLSTIAAVGLVAVLFFVVNVFQKGHINNLDKDISRLESDLRGNEDLAKILTIQNQLNNLTGLHEETATVSRLYEFLPQIRPSDPAEVSYGDIEIDFDEKIISITGNANEFKSVNELVDKMKFTKFTINGEEQDDEAFSNVLLADFKRDEDGATYTVTANFHEMLFNNTVDVALVIDKSFTTRSIIGRPLFEELPEQEEEPLPGEGQAPEAEQQNEPEGGEQ